MIIQQRKLHYLAKPWIDNNGPLQPYATIAVTTPNGTHLGGETKVDTSSIQSCTQYNERNDG